MNVNDSVAYYRWDEGRQGYQTPQAARVTKINEDGSADLTIGTGKQEFKRTGVLGHMKAGSDFFVAQGQPAQLAPEDQDTRGEQVSDVHGADKSIVDDQQDNHGEQTSDPRP